jgi:predicted PurR-regulated permease PerM
MARRQREGPSNATVARIVVVVAGVLVLLYAVYLVRSVLMLVVVAAFLAAGLDPAVRKLESFGLKRGQAVAAIFLAMAVFLAGFAIAVIPNLVEQVTAFATNLPSYVQDVAERNPQIREFVSQNQISQRLQSATSQIPSVIGGSFGRVLGVAGSVLGSIFKLLTLLILTIYFLLSFSRLRHGSMKLVPGTSRARVQELADPILEKIGGYIAGQITIALIAGVLAFVFLAVVGVPSPIALALWVSIAALIPLVGATFGAIPAVIVAFFTSVTLGIATLVYFIVYQQIENYLIQPRVMTKAVDISPAAVLLAALIGGSLLGFVGALMAIPAAASIKLIAQEIVLPKLETA